MKKLTLHSTLRILTIVLGITIASQASARHFRNSDANSFRTVAVVSTSTPSVFGDINGSGFVGTLRIPVSSPFVSITLRNGGDHDGDNGGDDDSTGDDDTTGGPHDGDTTHHGGGPGHGDNDNDSTDLGGGDSTGGDHGGDHGDNGNDTIECGGHHGHDNDSSEVNDSSSHSLFNGGKQSIVIKSHGQQANVNFTFTNNLATSVTITNMALVSGKNFIITSGAPSIYKPAKLAAGASISLKIAFNAADQNVHTDQLIVKSNSSATTTTISLTGQQLVAASVSSLPAGVAITTAPNPMTSSLKVSLVGVNSASVLIFDLSGKQVLSSSLNSSEWIWNGTASDGTMLLSGTYIVRLSGISTDGTPFASTQKIILAR